MKMNSLSLLGIGSLIILRDELRERLRKPCETRQNRLLAAMMGIMRASAGALFDGKSRSVKKRPRGAAKKLPRRERIRYSGWQVSQNRQKAGFCLEAHVSHALTSTSIL